MRDFAVGRLPMLNGFDVREGAEQIVAVLSTCSSGAGGTKRAQQSI